MPVLEDTLSAVHAAQPQQPQQTGGAPVGDTLSNTSNVQTGVLPNAPMQTLSNASTGVMPTAEQLTSQPPVQTAQKTLDALGGANPQGGVHDIQAGGIVNEDMLKGSVPNVNPYGQTSHYATSTAGHLDNLLDDDSLYLRNARTRGMQQANARGLSNSSMAATAGEQAAINAALPIAQQDSGQRQSLQQSGFSMSGNLQGQYTQHLGQIQANTTQAIAQISSAEGIDSGVKESLINGLMAQRDSDIAFIDSIYTQMPAWDATWPLLGGTTGFPNVGSGTGGGGYNLPAGSGGSGDGSDDEIDGTAAGLGALAGAAGELLGNSGALTDVFSADGGAGGAGGAGAPGAPPGSGNVLNAGDLTGDFNLLPDGALPDVNVPGGVDAGSSSMNVSDIPTGSDAFDLFPDGGLNQPPGGTSAATSGAGGAFDLFGGASSYADLVSGVSGIAPGLFSAGGTAALDVAALGPAFELFPAGSLGSFSGTGAAAGGGLGAGGLGTLATAGLAAGFAAPIIAGIIGTIMGESDSDIFNPWYEGLPDAQTIPAGQPGAGQQGVPFTIPDTGQKIWLYPGGLKYGDSGIPGESGGNWGSMWLGIVGTDYVYSPLFGIAHKGETQEAQRARELDQFMMDQNVPEGMLASAPSQAPGSPTGAATPPVRSAGDRAGEAAPAPPSAPFVAVNPAAPPAAQVYQQVAPSGGGDRAGRAPPPPPPVNSQQARNVMQQIQRSTQRSHDAR